MPFTNKLLPWQWGKKQVPVRHEDGPSFGTHHPMMHPEMSRTFDDFFRSFSMFPSGSSMFPTVFESLSNFEPKVDLRETEKELKVTAELPGMEDKDIDVSISRDSLTIRGEKTEEKEKNNKGYHRMERSYGSFHRVVWLPAEIDADNVDASFKNGVLSITMPKIAPSQPESKRITINNKK